MRGFPPSPDRRFRCLVLAAVLGAASLAGCSGKSTGADRPPATLNSGTTTTKTPATTTTAATTTTKPPSVEDQVKAAYLEAEADYYRVQADPSVGPGILSNRWSDPILTANRNTIDAWAREGIVLKFRAGSAPVSEIKAVTVGVGRANASLKVCVRDDTVQWKPATGETVNDAVVSQSIIIHLVSDRGRWKVSSGDIERQWPDLRGCDR